MTVLEKISELNDLGFTIKFLPNEKALKALVVEVEKGDFQYIAVWNPIVENDPDFGLIWLLSASKNQIEGAQHASQKNG